MKQEALTNLLQDIYKYGHEQVCYVLYKHINKYEYKPFKYILALKENGFKTNTEEQRLIRVYKNEIMTLDQALNIFS